MEKLRIKGHKIMAGFEMIERDRVFTVFSNRRNGGHQLADFKQKRAIYTM